MKKYCVTVNGSILMLFSFFSEGIVAQVSWAHDMLCSTSALLRPGTQSSRSISTFLLVSSRLSTAKFTLPIWTLAEGRHTHIHYTH